MKKLLGSMTAVLCAVLLSACTGIREYSGEYEETDAPAAVTEAQGIEVTDTLLSKVNDHLALFEYNKAVKLMEENAEECSSLEFDPARSILKKHFAELAKLYYTLAAAYVAKMEVAGYDYSTGFEGYDPESSSLDPAVIAEKLLSKNEAGAAKRVKILCKDDGCLTFKVTVEFCEMTACYPADDIALD